MKKCCRKLLIVIGYTLVQTSNNTICYVKYNKRPVPFCLFIAQYDDTLQNGSSKLCH